MQRMSKSPLDIYLGGVNMELLKHFILFYFLLNSIIVFIALKYDSPKGVVEQLGWWKLIKAILWWYNFSDASSNR